MIVRREVDADGRITEYHKCPIELVKINKEELIDLLIIQAQNVDSEEAHGKEDDLLLEFIDDAEITEAFKSVVRWYA